jgi:hypothetical protein
MHVSFTSLPQTDAWGLTVATSWCLPKDKACSLSHPNVPNCDHPLACLFDAAAHGIACCRIQLTLDSLFTAQDLGSAVAQSGRPNIHCRMRLACRQYARCPITLVSCLGLPVGSSIAVQHVFCASTSGTKLVSRLAPFAAMRKFHHCTVLALVQPGAAAGGKLRLCCRSSDMISLSVRDPLDRQGVDDMCKTSVRACNFTTGAKGPTCSKAAVHSPQGCCLASSRLLHS